MNLGELRTFLDMVEAGSPASALAIETIRTRIMAGA